jgi:SAM-dependent methyltransferase
MQSYKDFGNQFEIDSKIDEYWGSNIILRDIVSPFNLKNIKNKVIAEIGIGSGRIIKNLQSYNPKNIYAIEPSRAIQIAKKNLSKHNNIKFIKIKCENIHFKKKFDFIFSLGVIHHIPNSVKACKKIHNALKENGSFIMWLYAYEGNELYLKIFANFRKITIKLNDRILRLICYVLNLFLYFYIFICNFFELPMKQYLFKVFKKCSFEKRNYIIFDQLNPSYAKYYTKKDVKSLLEKSGFKKYKIFYRHKYSWTIIANK